MTHTLMENRNGLIVDVETTSATGKAEREAATTIVKRKKLRAGSTLAADKGYDAKAFVRELRTLGIQPHTAARKAGSALDARTTRHATYAISLKCRKMIEESFGGQDGRRFSQDTFQRIAACLQPESAGIRGLQLDAGEHTLGLGAAGECGMTWGQSVQNSRLGRKTAKFMMAGVRLE